ncbi:MAG: class I SAM-dependent methyltransferase [Gammaproteobacteria bacterium]
MIKCRITGDKTEKIISFGKMPIANGFLKKEEFSKEYFFELAVIFCSTSKMFQLIKQPDPKMMFHGNYAFFSSTSRSMAQHFEKMVNHYVTNFISNSKDAFVVELGSNDGIMLRHFAKAGINHLGIEPSANVAEVARQNGVNTVSEFFGEAVAINVENKYGKADIISAANVMCHIPDLNSVGKGVDILLKDKGIFVFEDPYLGDVIQKTAYDQIYDEHVYIFSVQSVSNTFALHGLRVFHVEPQKTHGGSMRYYLCRNGAYAVRDSVKKQLELEFNLGLDKIDTYMQFAKNCEKNKQDFLDLLRQLKAKGKRVVGYAATSKSTTILNYCSIGSDLIEYICDTTPIKQEKFSPGMHIPIKPYEYFKKDNPDYVVLFAWNHAQEIFEKERDFIVNGGKWIVFVPAVKVLSQEDSLVY